MQIKSHEQIRDDSNGHWIYFIKDPKENIIFDDEDDKKSYFTYLEKKSCSDYINKSYIKSTHNSKNVVLILVIDASKYQDMRSIYGFSYIKHITSSDFSQAYKVNTQEKPEVDTVMRDWVYAFQLVFDRTDDMLKQYQLRLAQVYSTYKFMFFDKLLKDIGPTVPWDMYLKTKSIVTFLYNSPNTNSFMDLARKFWKTLESYAYVCLLCSNKKKAGFILDKLSSMSHEEQKKYLGFNYQLISLNGIDTAYTYYVKQGFKRSLDGITYYPNTQKYGSYLMYFTGEYDGYLFVKRVGIPKQITG